MSRRILLPTGMTPPVLAPRARASITRGPSGGQRIDLAGGHAELVAEGGEFRLHPGDNAYRPGPAGAGMLRGQGDFTAAAGMRVVVTPTMPGQRPAQGRFTPRDVG